MSLFGISRRSEPAGVGDLIAASCFGFTPRDLTPGGNVAIEYEACNDQGTPVDVAVQAVFSDQNGNTVAREKLVDTTLGTAITNAPRCTGRLTHSVPAPDSAGDYQIDVIATITAERPGLR